ncbi:FtsH protease activity modulator HflK [Planctobacterium marinum]|uniref:Protein HflK n=1 Tax=Planctobacterium marinum TaxID=1631968 RepID=A0AA48HHY1_9ALTE|nr:HflK protein [Planctobacterium marinum]
MTNDNKPSGDPWRNPKNSPPDLDQLIKSMINRLKSFLPGGQWGGIKFVLLVILIVVTGWHSVYTVPSDSVAVVLRFGKYVGQTTPGLHFKFPFFIDVVRVVPVKRQLKQEFGFLTRNTADRTVSSRNGDMEETIRKFNSQNETQMVTGDLNAALVEWVVQYRISDPVKYLFEVRQPGETLRYVSESIMREVVGDRTVDEVITIGRQEIEFIALLKMQETSTKYAMGLSIDQVQLKNINPPNQVQESFNEVNQAQQEKEKLINEARRDYNKVIPLAEGEKDQRIREADGYRLRRVNEALGDTARFNAILSEYLDAPEVTKRRIYIETMQTVLPKVKQKVVLDSEMNGIFPFLNLNEKVSMPDGK